MSWKMIAEKEWEPWTFKQQCSSIMNVPKRSRVDVKISVINDLNFIYSSHKVVVWLLKMHMSCIHYIYDTFLQCFWSMKALVPINCNCIDKNNQYKVSPFVFHWKKKKAHRFGTTWGRTNEINKCKCHLYFLLIACNNRFCCLSHRWLNTWQEWISTVPITWWDTVSPWVGRLLPVQIKCLGHTCGSDDAIKREWDSVSELGGLGWHHDWKTEEGEQIVEANTLGSRYDDRNRSKVSTSLILRARFSCLPSNNHILRERIEVSFARFGTYASLRMLHDSPLWCS